MRPGGHGVLRIWLGEVVGTSANLSRHTIRLVRSIARLSGAAAAHTWARAEGDRSFLVPLQALRGAAYWQEQSDRTVVAIVSGSG